MNELVSECFARVWAMEPTHLRRLIATFEAIPQDALDAAIQKRIEAGTAQAFDNFQGNDKAEKPPRADVRDGVAHIKIAGPIMKTVPSVFQMFGIEATSTETVREMLAAAVEDPSVKSIVLDINSPGGTVDGVAELAGDIQAASDLKPVHAHASDLMASAAYWLGSQAGSVSAGTTAAVGSIGVYSVLEDTSAVAEKRGIKVHVVASHHLKGAGVDGSKITGAQLDDAQRVVNSYAALFTEAVSSGRGLTPEQAASVSTGQVWIGEENIALGLVDAVQGADAAHANSARGLPHRQVAKNPIHGQSAAKEIKMSQEQLAELEQLRAENAKLKAKAEADAAIAEARKASDVKALVAKYADRVPPAASAKVETFCASMSIADAEAYLAELPRIDRAAPSTQPVASSKPAPSFSAFEMKSAEILKSTPARLAALSNVEARFQSGAVKLTDGRVLSRDQFKAEFGV